MMFDWREQEADEYSHSKDVSFVELTTRSYLTAEGDAPQRVADPKFLALADAVAKLAALISQGTEAGIDIPGFKAYHPYPVQAVWSGGVSIEQRTHFKIWIKQPLFVDQAVFEQAINKAKGNINTTEIRFERLAEGTEIQSFSSAPLTADAPVWQTIITDGLSQYRLEEADPQSHREVYLDGVNAGSVLVRLGVKGELARIPEDLISFN